MPSLLRFFFRRLGSILLTLLIVSLLLFGLAMTVPPETRAELYFPKNVGHNFKESSRPKIIADIVARYGLNDPFPTQYLRWLGKLLQGDWGFSPTNNADVLEALLRLTPATAELTLYSLLLFLPLGLISGVIAATQRHRVTDLAFRLTAFVAASLPPFVLAILLLAGFYIAVHWFAPGRLSDGLSMFVSSDGFHSYTGLLTLDGLLNGRADISLDALRHLVLPVVTLSAFHWATLGRVTRTVMIEELNKEYVTAARARGLSGRQAIWRHALRNALVPALNSTALSAASLVTGVFVVESIFDYHGISQFIRAALSDMTPDIPAMLGFTIYSVVFVLTLMLVLDMVQAMIDPRVREGVVA